MVGKNLSHYKILEELGRGGMGIVYKAEDTKLDRTVAIKVLPSSTLASEGDRARFYREIRAILFVLPVIMTLALAGLAQAQVIEHKLTASDGAAADWFGSSVSLSGDFAVVGASGDDDVGITSGSAYMFERQGDGSWVELLKLNASDGVGNDVFGHSVSLSDDSAVIGAWRANNFSGSVYVYDTIFQTAAEMTVEFPQSLLLSTPFPNPLNLRAIVPFAVPEVAHVRLTLVDIFGREVATLLDENMTAGSHEVVLDGGHLASGVYIVRLAIEGVPHATKKVLLLH